MRYLARSMRHDETNFVAFGTPWYRSLTQFAVSPESSPQGFHAGSPVVKAENCVPTLTPSRPYDRPGLAHPGAVPSASSGQQVGRPRLLYREIRRAHRGPSPDLRGRPAKFEAARNTRLAARRHEAHHRHAPARIVPVHLEKARLREAERARKRREGGARNRERQRGAGHPKTRVVFDREIGR